MIKYNNIYEQVVDFVTTPVEITNFYISYIKTLNDLSSLFYFECISLNYSQILVSNLALNNILSSHFVLVLPEIFIIAMLFVLLLYSIWIYKKTNKHSVIDITFGLLSINFFSFIFYFNSISYKSYFLFNSLYLIDFYNIISKLIFLFSSSIVLFLTIFVFNKKKLKFNRYEYPIIIGFANLSCCLLISSFDLILLYLSIECLSFCLYILVLFKIKNKLTAEAGLKYFCLGVVASSSILFGISLIYGAICSTNFMYIKAYLDNCCTSDPLVYTGFIYILSGFFFKLAVFPYHMALIDVYDGSSLSVTTYLVTVVKFVMIIVLCKLLMYVFYSIQGLWSPLLAFVSITSMIFGSVGALYQQRIKRFFAYSSIHQVGYIILSLATGTATGLFSSIFYVIIYNLTAIGFFGVLIFYNSSHFTYKKLKLIYLNNLYLLWKYKPSLSIIFMVIIFSLANIPPFTSFFAKLYIFKSVMHCSYSYIWWLAFPALITSILSSFYYLRILKFMLFENFKFNVLNTIKYNFNINYVVTKDNLSLNLYKLIHTFVYFILIFLTIIFLGFPVFSNSFIILVETLSISCINPHNLLEYLAFKNSNYII